jgi:hypothetical protein
MAAEDRELVLAAQTALWGASMVLVVLVVGRLTVRSLSPLRIRIAAVAAVGISLATLVSFSHTAAVMSGGILDADQLGVVALVPAAIVATTGANFGRSLSPYPLSAWAAATVIAATLTTGLVVLGFIAYGAEDPSRFVALALGGLFCALVLTVSVRQLGAIRIPSSG